MSSLESYTCPCCGYLGLSMPSYAHALRPPFSKEISPPYSQYLGEPSYQVCPCCGYEFGNDDEPGTGAPISFERYLRDWINQGCIWHEPAKSPLNWSLAKQLAAAEIII